MVLGGAVVLGPVVAGLEVVVAPGELQAEAIRLAARRKDRNSNTAFRFIVPPYLGSSFPACPDRESSFAQSLT